MGNRDAENLGEQLVVKSEPIEGVPTTSGQPLSKRQPDDKRLAQTTSGQGSGDVGQLLRGAYRQTVDEAIPDDLMDLLNKLE